MRRLKSPEIPSPPGALDADGRGRQGSGGGSGSNSLPRLSERCKEFQYEELFDATNEFSPKNKIGEGGFGPVYKGTIDGELVAVKQLKTGGEQGEREFLAEVYTISRAHHRHVVSLVGYCISDGRMLLVYNYVPNGTMREALHGPGKPSMIWANRMKIALGTARGLVYLHDDCHPKIIHRDIKSSNILLDNQWEGQVADFGLARETLDSRTLFTARAGTPGYVAPEYAQYGFLSFKADVYSFGVVLLELITGKKAIDMSLLPAVGHVSLVEWAKPLLKQALENKNVDTVADPNLEGKYNKGEMLKMVEVAYACVRHSYHERPKMAEALQFLAPPSVHFNQANNSGQSGKFVSEEPSEDDLKRWKQIASGQPSSHYTEDGRSDEVLDASTTSTEEIVLDGQPIEDAQLDSCPATPKQVNTRYYDVLNEEIEEAQLSSAVVLKGQPSEDQQLGTTGEQENTRDIHVVNGRRKEEWDAAELSSAVEHPRQEALSRYVKPNEEAEALQQKTAAVSPSPENKRTAEHPSATSNLLTPPKPQNMESQQVDQPISLKDVRSEDLFSEECCCGDVCWDFPKMDRKERWTEASDCGKACTVLELVYVWSMLIVCCPFLCPLGYIDRCLIESFPELCGARICPELCGD